MLRTRTLASFAAALALVACEVTPVTGPDVEPSFARAGNAPVHFAAGGGTVLTDFGRSTYAFHASMDADGVVKGQVEIHFSSADLDIHGDVTCMSVAGNQAWLGAVITRSAWIDSPWSVGRSMIWTVIDNGEGRNAEADRISSYFAVASADQCLSQFGTEFIRDWTNGNAQVR